MKKELSKIYNPENIEEKWYNTWEKGNYFKPANNTNESHTIMIPPPNVTGILHLGHVLNNTIQDVLTRKARMDGKNTLWLPGTDHASIATEAKVTKYLKDKKIGEDQCKNSEKKIQNLTDAQISELEKKLREKEKEIMTI